MLTLGNQRLLQSEMAVLEKEEGVLKEMIKQYQNNLSALKVEELTLVNKLGQTTRERISRNTTPHSIKSPSSTTRPSPDLETAIGRSPIPMSGKEITMDELQINQLSLNLNATPLIHRMLHDQSTYEEEENEEEEEDE